MNARFMRKIDSSDCDRNGKQHVYPFDARMLSERTDMVECTRDGVAFNVAPSKDNKDAYIAHLEGKVSELELEITRLNSLNAALVEARKSEPEPAPVVPEEVKPTPVVEPLVPSGEIPPTRDIIQTMSRQDMLKHYKHVDGVSIKSKADGIRESIYKHYNI